jgi:DNA-binding MarR family transcriptional regulator
MGAPAATRDRRPNFSAGIRLLARLARVAERACLETGVSLPQYRLLVSISGRPQRASELAARVGVSRPTLTSLVDGLERLELLRRSPVATDRRGIRLTLTEAGRVAVERAERVLTDRLLQLVEPDMASDVAGVITSVDAALDREGEAQIALR